MTEPAVFSCDDFDRALADYRSGEAPERSARNVEFHASGCARCEIVLDHATRPAIEFSPTLPSDLRDSVLRSIASAPVLTIVRDDEPNPSTPRVVRPVGRFVLLALAVAAALTVVVIGVRDSARSGVAASSTTIAADTTDGTRSVNASRDAPMLDQDIGFEYTAARVATAHAQAEFEALEGAAQELEAALAQSPNDRELRAFLASVRARRDELTRRVREATS